MIGMADVGKVYAKAKSRYFRPSLFKRALYPIVIVFSVMIIGTLTFHYVENYSYLNSFYFMSMLATAQGPATVPVTNLGKILESLFAFISVGAVVFALGILFGPIFRRLLKESEEKFMEEERALTRKVKKYERKL